MIVPRRSSIAVRQALASTVVMLVAIGLITLAARVVIERQQRAAMLAAIDTDVAGLTDGMMTGGPTEVARRINDRTSFAGLAGARYRLADGAGRLLAGDLVQAIPLDPHVSQSGQIDIGGEPVLARATRLRGGYALVVTRSLRSIQAVLDRLTALFAAAVIPAVALSLTVGMISAGRSGRKLTAINRALDRFRQGERSARTGLPVGGDELGLLAGRVDAHLAQTDRLIEAQREISDNIAHELRTPLGHLDTRLLRAITETVDPAIEAELHRARADIRAIVSLFDALLDLALAEAGEGGGGDATLFDLSANLTDLTELYAASAEEAGLNFTTGIAPGVTMRGEPMAMTRAVANLLDNAFKFAPSGSHVHLTVAHGPQVVVEDDGPGIASADRDRVFERFRGTRSVGRGHGLGLALVRVIAARHGLVAAFEDARPGARFILEPGKPA